MSVDSRATVPTRTHQDDLSHGYIQVVEHDEHQQKLDMELIEACSKGFSMPVVFRKMVPLAEEVQTRAFLEIETDQKLTWRERQGTDAVHFRNKEGKVDYNYVSGQVGTAKEYLDAIFNDNKDVYAHLGKISSGFKNLETYPWGTTLFQHLHEEVFRTGWFDVPGWELTGHCFLGNNTAAFEDPSTGAPGSDWHMFPTTNVFVMLAGCKRWMTYPPQPGDQLRNPEELIFPSGGRESPVDERAFDTVYLEPGDVLFNVPYEWHKVLNDKGWSMGAAFRVIDRPYIEQLLKVPAIAKDLKLRKMSDNHAHLLTSLRHASRDPVRMQMSLNTMEMAIGAAARFGLDV